MHCSSCMCVCVAVVFVIHSVCYMCVCAGCRHDVCCVSCCNAVSVYMYFVVCCAYYVLCA